MGEGGVCAKAIFENAYSNKKCHASKTAKQSSLEVATKSLDFGHWAGQNSIWISDKSIFECLDFGHPLCAVIFY